MPTKLENLLDDLSSAADMHHKIGLKMLKADGGNLFPLDILATAVLHRSANLVPAFVQLIKAKNIIAAAPLLRLQIDNCIRFHAAWLVEDPHLFASAVLKGDHVRKIKDRTGAKMTDQYLVACFSKEFPWVTKVYERTSGYIHLSDVHVGALFMGSKTSEDGMCQFQWGPGTSLPDDSLYEEAVEAFIDATKAMFRYIGGWEKTKSGEQGTTCNPLASK